MRFSPNMVIVNRKRTKKTKKKEQHNPKGNVSLNKNHPPLSTEDTNEKDRQKIHV